MNINKYIPIDSKIDFSHQFCYQLRPGIQDWKLTNLDNWVLTHTRERSGIIKGWIKLENVEFTIVQLDKIIIAITLDPDWHQKQKLAYA